VNDACVLTGKPNVYGSIFRFEGQASVFATKEGPATAACIPSRHRRGWCFLRRGRRTGHSAGVGRRDASHEVIKLILGKGESLIGRLC